VRGIAWNHVTADLQKGANDGKSEAEYWFEK